MSRLEDRAAAMARTRDNPFERQLPQNIEAEQALLGALLVNNHALEILPQELEPRHFFEPIHRRIFETMRDLIGMGRYANPITVKSFLPSDDKIGGITVAQYLARLASDAVSIINAPDYAKGVMLFDRGREAISISEELSAAGFNCVEELQFDQKLEEIEERIAELRRQRASATETAAGDAYLKMFEGSIAKSGAAGVPVCLPEIAKVLSEPLFEAGNLYGLLSSSGEGKSSMTMQIIYHAIKCGHPVLFLSYDQSAGQCIRQMIAQVHGIEVRRQNDPQKFLKREEQDQCCDFAMWMNRQPLEIIRCRREGVVQLVAYGRRFVKRHANGKTPLIVTDHIGKVKPRDPKLSPDRISGEVTVEMKALADETGSANIVLNQRNTSGTIRDNPRPIARDLYGGEGAKADYDAILYLYRPEKYREERVAIATEKDWKTINAVFGAEGQWKDVAEVGVIKSRFGDPSLREELKFEALYTRYVSQRRQEPELF